MDTPIEQQTKFQNVTRHIAASEFEITEPNMLSTDFLNHVSMSFLIFNLEHFELEIFCYAFSIYSVGKFLWGAEICLTKFTNLLSAG